MKYYFEVRGDDLTHPVAASTIKLLPDKEIFKYFKRKYSFIIKAKILKAYIKLSLKFFNSLEGVINCGRVNAIFQAGLNNKSITKEYAYYCDLLKEYDFFFKYKRKFERLDKRLFKTN